MTATLDRQPTPDRHRPEAQPRAARELVTSRLKLRPLAIEDASRLAMFAADVDVARMTARIPHPYSEADARRFIARAAAADAEVWAVVHANGVVGVVGLEDDGKGGAELGYWLGKPFWGRGLVTEAAGAVIVASRTSCPTRAITASRFEDNPASARVLAKLGFTATGSRLIRCIARDADVRAQTYRLPEAARVPVPPNPLPRP